MTHRTLATGLILGVLVADQVTKLMARTHLADPVALGPLLNIQLGFNTGVSFGLFAGAGDLGRWLLVAGTGAVALWLLTWMWRESRLVVAAPLALIAGGALGNIIDRVRMGGVTDFIDVHFGNAHWPTFNLADTAITIGVAWLLLASLRRQAPATSPPSPPAKGHL
ncbi:MAG: signal peptidase II [Caulobacter sp.]|nr:signal peptidase II [Caulobacter sp.]